MAHSYKKQQGGKDRTSVSLAVSWAQDKLEQESYAIIDERLLSMMQSNRQHDNFFDQFTLVDFGIT